MLQADKKEYQNVHFLGNSYARRKSAVFDIVHLGEGAWSLVFAIFSEYSLFD